MTTIPQIPLTEEEYRAFDELDEYLHGYQVGRSFPINDTGKTYNDLVAQEIFAALDKDGSVPTAQYLIEMIDTGRIYGERYISGQCGCFYGHLTVCETAKEQDITPEELWQNIPVDLDTAGERLSEEFRISIPILENWNFYTTPVENFLIANRITQGDTAETESTLAFIKKVLQAYIAEKS